MTRKKRRSTLTLQSGRRVEVRASDEGDWLSVRSPEGACVLTVLLTDQGPVLRFEAAALQVAVKKSIQFSCEDYSVQAKNEIRMEGRAVGIAAKLGGISLRADDDVAIDGERVLLNSTDGPQQLSWDEFLEQERS